MSRKGKRLFKNLSLGILGLGILGGAVALGTNYLKNDSVNIHPSFEVGNLTSYGKFVEDESTIYTKDSFACDGLSIKLDFDSEINYKIYFYDSLDNFIEATDLYTDSSDIEVKGVNARLVVIPTNDDDDKISWAEKHKYANQLDIRVSKNQNNSDVLVGTRRIMLEDNVYNLQFVPGELIVNSNTDFDFGVSEGNIYSVTSYQVLKVDSKYMFNVNQILGENKQVFFNFYFLKNVEDKLVIVGSSKSITDSAAVIEDAEYVIIEAGVFNTSTEEFTRLEMTDELCDLVTLSLSYKKAD